MLEAKYGGSAHKSPNPTTPLLAFKPRQVLLSLAHAQAQEKIKDTTMKKHCSSLNHDQKALLLHSILSYLQHNGFSRTLKRLLSEAQIENDNWKTSSLNLEDMYGNYLETCIHADTNFDTYKKQELLINGITKKDGDSRLSNFEKTAGKKKRSDGDAAVNQSGTAEKFAESAKSRDILPNDLLTDSNVELKEKKKIKKISDSLCQTEQVSAPALKDPPADTVCELQTDESTKKQRDKKKKKSHSISESLDGNVEQVQLDSLLAVKEEKCKNLKPSLGDSKIDSEGEGNSKNKKKKKKKNMESLVESIEPCNSALENIYDIPLEEKKVESKRKKERLAFETLSCGFAEVPNKEKSELEKESFQTSEGAIDKEKKSSKKRKRLSSDENEDRPVEKLASEELKHRKTERWEQTKSCEQLTKVNAITGDNEQEIKGDNNHVGQNEFQDRSIQQLEAHANGNNLQNNGEKSASEKTRRKQHNGSAEPKTVNAFQRVKVDEVEFVDEKLQDNSYWAKDGAEVGYGAKAQEILGQVRGRDFRHEKTKKKRGSYRGGQIDLQSHSVKFNYADDD